MHICRRPAAPVACVAIMLPLVTFWPAVGTAQNACEAETAGLQAAARGVQVEISPGTDLKSGDVIKVSWRAAARFPAKTPAFALLAVPGEVRIEAAPAAK